MTAFLQWIGIPAFVCVLWIPRGRFRSPNRKLRAVCTTPFMCQEIKEKEERLKRVRPAHLHQACCCLLSCMVRGIMPSTACRKSRAPRKQESTSYRPRAVFLSF